MPGCSSDQNITYLLYVEYYAIYLYHICNKSCIYTQYIIHDEYYILSIAGTTVGNYHESLVGFDMDFSHSVYKIIWRINNLYNRFTG